MVTYFFIFLTIVHYGIISFFSQILKYHFTTVLLFSTFNYVVHLIYGATHVVAYIQQINDNGAFNQGYNLDAAQ